MKTALQLIILITLTVTFSGCNPEGNSNLNGLVSFHVTPVYTQDLITFEAQIQFGGVGGEVEIEYQVLDGTTLVAEGSAMADYNPDGMGLFYETESITVSITGSSYTGKFLTVWLDPDNKITSAAYTTQLYVDLYKKANVLIP